MAQKTKKSSKYSEKDHHLRHNSLSFIGSSRAGYHTHIRIPELSLVFDIGRCTMAEASCKTVLLSHVHSDHSLGAVRHIALRKMMNMGRGRIYLPQVSLDDFSAMLECWNRLDRRPSPIEDIVVGVEAGDTLTLGKGLEADVLEVDHTAPSVGFTLRRKKTKLKDEYRQLTGPEIGERVRAGENVRQVVEETLATYIGDSTARVFDQNPQILKSPVLILECTYIDDGDQAIAAERGHMHISDVAERAAGFEGDLLILKHFSLKNHPSVIRKAVALSLPEALHKKTRLLL